MLALVCFMFRSVLRLSGLVLTLNAAAVAVPHNDARHTQANAEATQGKAQREEAARKARDQSTRRQPPAVLDSYGKLPLSFEANSGQVQQPVKFISRGNGYTLFLTGTEAVVALNGRPSKRVGHSTNGREAKEQAGATLRMKFVGANSEPRVTGEGELPGVVNYLIGDRPERWQTGVSTYSRVRYKEIYPGIDVVYYGNQGRLEYDFVIAPGANPSQVGISFAGARGLRVEANGDLSMRVGAGEIRQLRPVIYQEVDGVRRPVMGSYVLRGQNKVGFLLGHYDPGKALVIDPVLSYSTYIGGSDADYSEAVAVDGSGNAYISGYTRSVNFPTTPGALKSNPNFGYNVFVSKLNATGTALLYSTYVGGNGQELNVSLAVDAAGQAYLAGQTSSNNFPTTPGAYQTMRAGNLDVFVSKLNAEGNGFAYSTLVGSGDNDDATSIAVDAAGNAYVTGSTGSNPTGLYFHNFPTTPGAFQRTYGSTNWTDAYVLKLNATGTNLIYSTLLGGNRKEIGNGIAVDAAGNAYVAGLTESDNFPVTPGAFQTTAKTSGFGSPVEAFVTKLNASGTALVYSTYLGGVNSEQADGIALDGAGHAYVTGYTSSPGFPTTPGSFQPGKAPDNFSNDAFAVKLNPAGTTLLYSTFIGGSDVEFGLAIAVDPSGNAYVGGLTGSTDFPLTPDAFAREGSAFLTQLSPTGAGLHSLRFGGSGFARFSGVAVDQKGGAYVTGYTNSNVFPTTTGAYQTAYRGGESDSFVVKFSGFAIDSTPAQNLIGFSAANFDVAEDAGRAALTVSRTGDISGQASVRYLTLDNQAAVRCDDRTTAPEVAFARCDYSTTVDTLYFAAGEAQKTFNVSIIDDAHVEGAEKVQLQLADPVGATLGAQHTATLTITNDDAPGEPNPIFDNAFFVRQHYLDFLSREPDQDGMDAWTGVLNRCSDVNNNPECDRITVSSAFFRSIEFQLKGYFVYRFYKVSFGTLPLYNEIITDMRSITGETAAEVFAKRTLFADEWVERPSFKSIYDGLDHARFVDRLMNRYVLAQITTPDPSNPDGTTKVTLTRSEMVDRLLARTLTRAQVVRAIADSDEVSGQEYNRAFVAMQYYGYLRRTPEQEGYNSWLRVINEDPGNVRVMVNGFMNSVEYRLRFGQP